VYCRCTAAHAVYMPCTRACTKSNCRRWPRRRWRPWPCWAVPSCRQCRHPLQAAPSRPPPPGRPTGRPTPRPPRARPQVHAVVWVPVPAGPATPPPSAATSPGEEGGGRKGERGGRRKGGRRKGWKAKGRKAEGVEGGRAEGERGRPAQARGGAGGRRGRKEGTCQANARRGASSSSTSWHLAAAPLGMSVANSDVATLAAGNTALRGDRGSGARDQSGLVMCTMQGMVLLARGGRGPM
jgi:hypothetical protein